MSFNCTKCGACCRRAFLLPGFPFPVGPDGACSKLVNNQCSIYETRPDVCRHSVARVAALGAIGLTPEEYDAASVTLCNRLQIADGMDESWRMKFG